MPTSLRFAVFALPICFAVSPPGSGAAMAQQPQLFPALKDAVPFITTTGVASAEVVPDIATILLGVDTERPKAADAARDNARAAQAIVGEIRAQGIDAKDIKTLSITLSPVYDDVTNANGRAKRTLRGYLAHNALSVRVRDIARAGILASQLMDKGANSLDGIEFDYSQKDAKYDALRVEAVRDALRKANSYASGLGIRLGRILAVTTQSPEPMPYGMPPRAGAFSRAAPAAIPVEPGADVLRTEVQVTWELAQ